MSDVDDPTEEEDVRTSSEGCYGKAWEFSRKFFKYLLCDYSFVNLLVVASFVFIVHTVATSNIFQIYNFITLIAAITIFSFSLSAKFTRMMTFYGCSPGQLCRRYWPVFMQYAGEGYRPFQEAGGEEHDEEEIPLQYVSISRDVIRTLRRLQREHDQQNTDNNEEGESVPSRLNLFATSILERFPRLELTERNEEILKKKCSICLSLFEVGDNCSNLPCLHHFHYECIKKWMRIGQKPTCPECNLNIIEYFHNSLEMN